MDRAGKKGAHARGAQNPWSTSNGSKGCIPQKRERGKYGPGNGEKERDKPKPEE